MNERPGGRRLRNFSPAGPQTNRISKNPPTPNVKLATQRDSTGDARFAVAITVGNIKGMRLYPRPRVWEMYLMCGIFAAIGVMALIRDPANWRQTLVLMLPFAFLFWFLRRFC